MDAVEWLCCSWRKLKISALFPAAFRMSVSGSIPSMRVMSGAGMSPISGVAPSPHPQSMIRFFLSCSAETSSVESCACMFSISP